MWLIRLLPCTEVDSDRQPGDAKLLTNGLATSLLTKKAMGVPISRSDTQRRESQRHAQKLLTLCRCSHCQLPVKEPVTLPCGHSSCLHCIIAVTSGVSSSTALPCSSHLPPRLPLSSTTVPCPEAGCPRNAIGKGMGVWSGHSATYGPGPSDGEKTTSLPSSVSAGPGVGPGSTPLDGFVVPQNQDGNRLVVIPAQRRSASADKYAISNFSMQGALITQEASMLRPDVTLTKVVELLNQHAAHTSILDASPSTSSSSRRLVSQLYARNEAQTRHRRLRKRMTALRRDRRDTPSPSSSPSPSPAPSSHHPAGSRTEINPLFLSVLGVSERGRDSGAVGGISATWESDDAESDGDEAEVSNGGRLWWDEEDDASVQDDDDEEIGGAFARQYTPPILSNEDRKIAAIESSTVRVGTAKTAKQAFTPETLHSELLDVLECQLCYMLLYQPLTTPCGHTFCRQCFARSLDHSSACPLCRADMPSFAFFQEHPTNKIVMNLLTTEWARSGLEKDRPSSPATGDVIASANDSSPRLGLKQLYFERQAAMEKEARESLLSTPLFVCTLAFPDMPTILHIFEPRYRLMIRRCLESGHARFGMVLLSQEMSGPVPGMSRYGTMLEIKTVQMLTDGRSMIETVGSHRFRVLERGSLDGYTVGQIERIDDVTDDEAEDQLEQASLGVVEPSASPAFLAEAREAQAAFQAAIGIDLSRGEAPDQATPLRDTFTLLDKDELISICNGFIETVRSGSAPWLMTRLNSTYGPMPEPANVAAFGYWMALVLPIDEHEKAKLLPIRSPRLRLRIVVYWIEQLRQTWWFNHGCSIT